MIPLHSKEAHASAPTTAEHPNGQGPTLAERVRSLRLPARPESHTGGGSWWPWVVCLGLAGATAYFAYAHYEAERRLADLEATASKAGPTSGATVASAALSAGKRNLETGGYLLPLRRVQISP